MKKTNLQLKLFKQLNAKIPAHVSMAEEVAELLEISTDSAYRRINGSKPLLLEEALKICKNMVFRWTN